MGMGYMDPGYVEPEIEQEGMESFYYMGGMFNGTMRPPFNYDSFYSYEMAQTMGYLGYSDMGSFNAANYSPPVENSLMYAGEGTFGTAGYRPAYTYASQAEYDAAVSGGYLGYMSMAMYSMDSASRGEGGGGGGGGYETTSAMADVVYSAGSLSSSIGEKMMGTPYELQGGEDTFGVVNSPFFPSFSDGTSMDDFVKGNQGNDTIYGGAGNDWLMGDEDSDNLYGNAGDDILVGGQGTDFLYGGATMAGGQVLVGGDANESNLSMLSNPMMWSANTTPDSTLDFFIFQSGEGAATYTGTTGIADYEDGTDKIALLDSGANVVSTPFLSGVLTSQSMFGFTAVQEVATSNFLFYVNGTVTFDDSDVQHPYV